MNSASELFQPDSDAELAACFPAFHALRPHLSLDAFVQQVRRQSTQGYRIVAVRAGEQVPSAAGYRFAEFLAWGKVLYVDDLTTLESARGQGHGGTAGSEGFRLGIEEDRYFGRRAGCGLKAQGRAKTRRPSAEIGRAHV